MRKEKVNRDFTSFNLIVIIYIYIYIYIKEHTFCQFIEIKNLHVLESDYSYTYISFLKRKKRKKRKKKVKLTNNK